MLLQRLLVGISISTPKNNPPSMLMVQQNIALHWRLTLVKADEGPDSPSLCNIYSVSVKFPARVTIIRLKRDISRHLLVQFRHYLNLHHEKWRLIK